MRKILFSLLAVVVSLTFAQTAFAADLNLECFTSPTDHCDLTGTNPLFSSVLDSVWYPGRIITKTINLKNSTSDQADLKLRGRRNSIADIFEDVLRISIYPTLGGSVIWSGSLAQFYGADYISMGTFSGGANQDYSFAVSMDSSANDDYQGLSSIFDLDLNFASFGPGGAGAGGVGGGGNGGGVSAPSCDDPAAGGAPSLLSATVSGPNQVTLTWSKALDPVTYYLVAYGLSAGNPLYGNPNVGGKDTTSYVVNNLSGGTTYYFRVRAGNGCNGGPYSNELSATPGGAVITGPAAGFAPGVLGVTSEEESTPSAVLGAESSPSPTSKPVQQTGLFGSFKNWLLLLFLLVLIFLGWRFTKRNNS